MSSVRTSAGPIPSMLDAATAALLNTIEPDYHAWFAQADYIIYPWLQATYRYETVTPGD